MPRIKTDLLEKGMRVITDVKNMDEMLLIPAGAILTERQISILQAWGIEEIEVQQASTAEETDPLSRLTPEAVAKLSAEIKSLFWKPDETEPVFGEIVKLMLQRRVRKATIEPPP